MSCAVGWGLSMAPYVTGIGSHEGGDRCRKAASLPWCLACRGLKNFWVKARAGSTPAPGTIDYANGLALTRPQKIPWLLTRFPSRCPGHPPCRSWHLSRHAGCGCRASRYRRPGVKEENLWNLSRSTHQPKGRPRARASPSLGSGRLRGSRSKSFPSPSPIRDRTVGTSRLLR